jgi:hypothetical protein
MLVLGVGLGPLFVLIFLVGLTRVRDGEAGVASGLVNVGQQVGARSGWRSSAPWPGARSPAACDPRPPPRPRQLCTCLPRCSPACTTTRWRSGSPRVIWVSAGVLALAVIIALVVIPVSRQDLSGPGPAPERPVTPTRTWREAWKPRRPDRPGATVSQNASPGPGTGRGPAGPWPGRGRRSRLGLCVPSLLYRWPMWVLTVLCETYSSPAISGPVRLVGR